MDRVSAAVVRRLDNPVELQVGLGRRRSADVMRFVRVADMDRGPVGVRIDRRGRDAKLAACAHDPDRDLAAIGDEDFAEELFLQPIASRG